MIAIPFSCTDWSSFHEIRGLLRLEDEALVLEYRISYWGCVPKAKVREAIVPRELVVAASFKQGWFGNVLTIQTASLKAWQEFPGAMDGRTRLSIAREDRDAALELAALLAPGKMAEPVDEFA